jgi:hypothetical protein
MAAERDNHNGDRRIDQRDVRLDQQLLHHNNEFEFNRFDDDDFFVHNDCGFSCNDVDLVQFPPCFPFCESHDGCFNNCNDKCFNNCNDKCFNDCKDGCESSGGRIININNF